VPDDDTTTTTAEPTWYGTIRHMFTRADIAHMSPQGLDLTSYDQVRASAGAIYGQVSTGAMPPGQPWSKEIVATFLTWMTNGYPKGSPTSSQVSDAYALLADKVTASRIRKDIETLTSDELDRLIEAFQGILAKDTSDPDSYFVQAGYHWLPAPLYCLHHVPGYNPWHRAYMLSFENALRSVPGCGEVTLPYWDITKPFPEVLKKPPFDSYTLPEGIGPGFDAGYVTQRFDYSEIADRLKLFDVTADLERALTKTDWEDFHGYWSGAPYDTIIAAHDGGHGSIGLTMANQSVAAYDPVFWFFHANWDRLWWEWQKKMSATDLTGLLSTINQQTDQASYQIFTVPVLQSLEPFTSLPIGLDSVKVIDSAGSLDVDYAPAEAGPTQLSFSHKAHRAVPVDRPVSINPRRATVSVDGVNRLAIPGSFEVHLMKDGERLASRFLFQPEEVEKCETCVDNPIAHFDFDLPLDEVSKGRLTVQVEPIDKSFVGDRFPTKLMGEPKISVYLPVRTE
jgi:tyrosinase